MSMAKQTIIGAAFGLLLGSPALGDDTCKLGGMWRLVSFHSEDVVTTARIDIFGERPRGYLTVGCDGRFYAWAETAQAEPVRSIWEDVARSMSKPAAPRRAIHYSGTYRLNANNLVARVDNASYDGPVAYDASDLTWNEWLSRTDEVRSARIEPNGTDIDLLIIETAPMPSPNDAGSTIIGRTVWERALDWLGIAPPY